MSKFSNESGCSANPSNNACSPLNTFAWPLKILFSRPPSTPANLSTALNSGERFPPKTLSPPVSLKGFSTG